MGRCRAWGLSQELRRNRAGGLRWGEVAFALTHPPLPAWAQVTGR